jgi:hypothetical protein
MYGALWQRPRGPRTQTSNRTSNGECGRVSCRAAQVANPTKMRNTDMLYIYITECRAMSLPKRSWGDRWSCRPGNKLPSHHELLSQRCCSTQASLTIMMRNTPRQSHRAATARWNRIPEEYEAFPHSRFSRPEQILPGSLQMGPFDSPLTCAYQRLSDLGREMFSVFPIFGRNVTGYFDYNFITEPISSEPALTKPTMNWVRSLVA